LRKFFSVGLDLEYDAELFIYDGLAKSPTHTYDVNHYHGNPYKYRLRNLSKESVDDFFQAYSKGELPSYWVSKEPWTWGKSDMPKEEAYRITGPVFENFVLESDSERGRLVAFFNDDPKDKCQQCKEGRKVWEEVAKRVRLTGAINKKIVIAAIDQSQNEHPEKLVPGKLAQPLLVWYPPGTKAQRLKRKRVLRAPKAFTVDKITDQIEDLIVDDEEEEL